jgi:hypothetical protein
MSDNATGETILKYLTQEYLAKREKAAAALTLLLNKAHHTDQIAECAKWLEELADANGVLEQLKVIMPPAAEQQPPPPDAESEK